MIGGRLRELRLAKGLTQEELGKSIGVGKSAICQYESGAREPDTASLMRMAGFFGVTTDWLLGADGPERFMVREPGAVYEASSNTDEKFLAELQREAGAIRAEEDRRMLLEMARFLARRKK